MPEVPVSPIVGEVLNTRDEVEGREAIALVGYVGVGSIRDGESPDVRLYPDADFARWMDIPQDMVVTSAPLTTFGSGRLQRTMVWVDAEFFTEEAVDFTGTFARSEISTWPLIPATRLVAAQMLDLLPDSAHDPRSS